MKTYTITEELLNEAIGGLNVYGKIATSVTVEKLESMNYPFLKKRVSCKNDDVPTVHFDS